MCEYKQRRRTTPGTTPQNKFGERYIYTADGTTAATGLRVVRDLIPSQRVLLPRQHPERPQRHYARMPALPLPEAHFLQQSLLNQQEKKNSHLKVTGARDEALCHQFADLVDRLRL